MQNKNIKYDNKEISDISKVATYPARQASNWSYPNFNSNNLIKEFEILFKNKTLFYQYYDQIKYSLKNSSFQKFKSDIIIDYLKKSSLAIKD